MSVQPEFLNSIIELSDPFIRKYGGEEGYQRFRRDSAESISISTNISEFSRTFIEAIENNEPESPLYSRLLLSLYAVSEKNSKAPEFLKSCVLDRLFKISDGESADSVFHLGLTPNIVV